MQRLNLSESVASSLPLKAYQQIWKDANQLSTYGQLGSNTWPVTRAHTQKTNSHMPHEACRGLNPGRF